MNQGTFLAKCHICMEILGIKFQPRIDNRIQDLVELFDQEKFQKRREELIVKNQWYSKFGSSMKLELGSIHEI